MHDLCLEVLGEKENDKVSNTVNKLLKVGTPPKAEKATKKEQATHQQVAGPTPQALPPAGFMPQYPPGMHNPYGAQQYAQPQMQYGFQPYGQPYGGFQGYGGHGDFRQSLRGKTRPFSRTKALCHFCRTEGNLLRDCAALKKLRESQNKYRIYSFTSRGVYLFREYL